MLQWREKIDLATMKKDYRPCYDGERGQTLLSWRKKADVVTMERGDIPCYITKEDRSC